MRKLNFDQILYEAVVAEWLRRLTRNQIPFGSAGSNPADCVFLYKFFQPQFLFNQTSSFNIHFLHRF